MKQQSIDFLQVVKGLQDGYVYKHPSFSPDEYLVLDAYGDIRFFDNYEVRHIDFTPTLVLSNEWMRCEKKVWLITSTQMDFHLFSDEVYVYYQLKRNEEDDSWDQTTLSLDELREHQCYVGIAIAKDARLSAEEREKITHLLCPNSEKEEKS